MNYTRYVFLVLAAVISALTSCSSVRSGFDYAASGLNKVVNPDAERMRSGIVWNKPAPRVGRSKDRTVYVVMEDISGLEIPAGKIESEILSKLESKGYEVVDDIDNAYYRLEVFLRYFGPNPRADRGRNPAIARELKSIAGGTLGSVLGRNGNIPSRIPALGGDMVKDGIQAGMRVKEYDFIADVNLYEKLAKSATKHVKEREREVQWTKTRVIYDGDNKEGGSSNDTVEARMDYSKLVTHRNHKRRVTVWVQKARLTEEEAQSVAMQKMTKALDGLLRKMYRG